MNIFKSEGIPFNLLSNFCNSFRIMKLHQVLATEYFPGQNEENVRSRSQSGNSNSALQNPMEYAIWAVIPLWPLFLLTSTFLKEHVISQKIHHSEITESEKVNEHYLGSKQYSISLCFMVEVLGRKNIHEEGGSLNSRKRCYYTKYPHLQSSLEGSLGRSYNQRLSCV